MAIFLPGVHRLIEKTKSRRLVAVKEANRFTSSVKVVEGLRFECDYFAPDLGVGASTQFIIKNPYIFVSRELPSSVKLKQLLRQIYETGNALVVVASDVDSDVLSSLASLRRSGALAPIVVKTAYADDRGKRLTDYIAAVAGQTIEGRDLDLNKLGHAGWVVLEHDHCAIIDTAGKGPAIRSGFEALGSDAELANLESGAALIEVGGLSKSRQINARSRVEQALAVADRCVYDVTLSGPSVTPGVPAPPPNPQRYVNVLFTESDNSAKIIARDQPLVAGRPYRLVVEVNPERAGLGEDDAVFPDKALDQCWDVDRPLSILVAVSSSQFQIEPRVQQLQLPRRGPSSPVSFAATPLVHTGPGCIQVELFYRGNLLQSKQIEAYIIPSPAAERPVTAKPMQTARTTFTITSELNPTFLNQLPERVLAIVVERDSKSGTYDFRYLDRTQGDTQVACYHTQVQAENLETPIEAVRGILEQAARAYEYNLDGTDELFNAWLPVLAHLGRNLYRMLLPAEQAGSSTNDEGARLKATLKPDSVIQVNPVVGKATVPWAILYERMVSYVPGKTRVCERFADSGPDCDGCPKAADPYTVCPHAFWGYRYSIEQLPCWTSGVEGKPSELVRAIRNGDPLRLSLNVWNRFAFWENHRLKLKRMIDADPLVAERLQDMEKIWRENSDLDVVYFYCHGGTDPTLREPYLELSDARIYSNNLEALAVNWPHAPLVFLNGCATGDYRPDSYISLIDDFRKSGASGVVGTECPVPEFFAEAFASELFPLFFGGGLLGRAMLETRRRYLRCKNPLGMAYALYAAHDIVLNLAVAQPEAQT